MNWLLIWAPSLDLDQRFFWMLFRIKWRSSSSIIGQFGVGFYSAFMVADKVDVYSQSAEPGVAGYKWSSDGSEVFEIAEASGVRQGTKIVLNPYDLHYLPFP
ncbi:heat shock protein 75 kDa, mitochondrial [Labeo rohita]|uniref:heat shock protein 75 kDa, mitochondrial n=1 Tax=Labeo rohita TaxID=84645 RepID=UPI0021E29C1D|nr:heat shock protein 75 kDa, mitochondrial [Labeo rohita]XP_050959182.1 heat shock protein 75 kDa, mitochondrial [Labeo rohita]